MIYAVIMAGGVGSRLWPMSRKKMPKQFLDVLGDGSMIQKTVQRLKGIPIPDENIYVVTNKSNKAIVRKQLPQLKAKHILVEPVGKNTAPCIALATSYIQKRDPEATIIVLPADHIIRDVTGFQGVLRACVEVAGKTNAIVTIGIKPTRPETGYGYIQCSDRYDLSSTYRFNAFKVKTFAEKPTAEIAEQFLASGDFLWNSGMFIWRAEAIAREIKNALPHLYDDMQRIKAAIGTKAEHKTIEDVYSWTTGVSIDYGVMEKTKEVYVVEGDFGWSDVGSWDEVAKLKERDERGNSVGDDNVIYRNTKSTFILKPADKTVAVVGVDNLIIIDTPDALLICKKGSTQDVKEIVDTVKRKQLEHLL
jgi:mannose-1-phosphate guanylyltransferase